MSAKPKWYFWQFY